MQDVMDSARRYRAQRLSALTQRDSKRIQVGQHSRPAAGQYSIEPDTADSANEQHRFRGHPSSDSAELGRDRLAISVHDAQGDDARANLRCGGDNVRRREIGAEVQDTPPFASGSGGGEHRTKLVVLRGRRRDDDAGGRRWRFVRIGDPREHAPDGLRRQVLVRRGDRAAMPAIADRAEKVRKQLVDERFHPGRQRRALQCRLERERIEHLGCRQRVAQRGVRRDRFARDTRRPIRKRFERRSVEPRDLADAVPGRGGALQQNEALDIIIRIQALPALRPTRRNCTVPALPRAQHVGTQAGPPHHGAERIPRGFACGVVHAIDGSSLSTYGQCFAIQIRMKQRLEGVTIARSGGTHWILETAQSLPLEPDEVFPFFADAGNLERITPPELRFHIETPTPIAMRVGQLIDYRIRLSGIPLCWRTLITEWNPPFEFVDVQTRGPYAEWVHRHRFSATDEGTLVEDEVRFALPLSYVGLVVAPIVKRQLRRIFTYRHDAIRRLLLPESR